MKFPLIDWNFFLCYNNIDYYLYRCTKRTFNRNRRYLVKGLRNIKEKRNTYLWKNMKNLLPRGPNRDSWSVEFSIIFKFLPLFSNLESFQNVLRVKMQISKIFILHTRVFFVWKSSSAVVLKYYICPLPWVLRVHLAAQRMKWTYVIFTDNISAA